MPTEPTRFRQFCVVEVAPSLSVVSRQERAYFLLGEVSEERIANYGFLRVDLPAYGSERAKTVLLNPANVRQLELKTEAELHDLRPRYLGRPWQEE